MLRHLFILFAVSSVVFGAAYIAKLEDKPEEYENCDGCWVSEINTFIPINETVPSDTECKEYKCSTKYVQIFTCGVIGYDKTKCHLVYDTSLPYPGCCGTLVCP